MNLLFKRIALLPLLGSALIAAGPDFHEHIGMQLWSVRAAMKENEKCALDLVQITGVNEVETAGTGKLSVDQFAQELQSRGLKAVSAHYGYDALKKDVAGVIREAKTLGVSFIICPWLNPDKRPHSAADAQAIAADFNAFGEACHAAGLQFGYHPHGFEFIPTTPGGSDLVFDILVRNTKPDLVCFEMDVFWIAHAGQDPVTLLKKYPSRWRLMHVKDMRKGAPTGFSTGSAPDTDSVAVGKGRFDWKAILSTAQQIGIEYYFLEDETPTPLDCIPDSLQYLRALKL